MRSYGNVFGKGEEGSEADQTPDLSVENNPEGRARWWQGQDTDIDWFCAGWLSATIYELIKTFCVKYFWASFRYSFRPDSTRPLVT